MTEDLGAGRASLTPFGEQFLVNGEEVRLRNLPPEQWGETTYLTNETWDRDAFAPGARAIENVASDTAGVMVSETEVRDNRMTFHFAHSQDSRRADYGAGVIFVNETWVSDNLMTVQFVLPEDETYLTGIILEPVTVESSVKGYPDTTELLEYEGLVAAATAEVLEGIAPAAGEPTEDTLQTGEAPSPS